MSEDRADMVVVGTIDNIRPRPKGADVVTVTLTSTVRDKTIWTRVSCWRDLASKVEDLSPGTRLEVVGYPKINSWTNKDGEAKNTIECVAVEVTVCDVKRVPTTPIAKRGGKSSKVKTPDEDFDF